MSFPLQSAEPAELGLDPDRLERLCAHIETDIAAGLHPGAQIAVARHGRLALFRAFGAARQQPATIPTDARTLSLVYSNTKVITAAAIWMLAEDGMLSFNDSVADHLPGFERHRKGDITILHLLTHQGGFPNAVVPMAIAGDHAAVLQAVCDIRPEWAAGTRVQYHSASAHWVLAMVIEAVTGADFRDVIRDRLLARLGLDDDIKLGVSGAALDRCADMHAPDAAGAIVPLADENTPAFRAAGRPGGGAYATARGMAAFYQMLVGGGRLGDVRVLSPRMIEFATRSVTGERMDLQSGKIPHRALGPATRGDTGFDPGLGMIANARTFGHGGAGSSYCWGDPVSGVSFAFLSNARLDDAVHDRRTQRLSTMAHAAILD